MKKLLILCFLALILVQVYDAKNLSRVGWLKRGERNAGMIPTKNDAAGSNRNLDFVKHSKCFQNPVEESSQNVPAPGWGPLNSGLYSEGFSYLLQNSMDQIQNIFPPNPRLADFKTMKRIYHLKMKQKMRTDMKIKISLILNCHIMPTPILLGTILLRRRKFKEIAYMKDRS